MTIANTILQQLGGNKFRAMTGASGFLDCGNALRFKLPARFARDGIRLVEITLCADDLYRLDFARWNGRAASIPAPVKSCEGVYADQLRQTFTLATGLEVSL